MSQDARVPSVYRLVSVARADDVAETARTLAAGGAEDGTLVWAQQEKAGGPPTDLACALVLRPDCSAETAVQLSYVGVLALAEALGTLLPPTPLTFVWPGTLVLCGARIAEVRVETAAAGEDNESTWLLLLVRVHVGCRRSQDLEQLTSLGDEGCGDVTGQAVLEAFARHFLSWAGSWLDQGFGPVRASWMKRAEGVGAEITLPVGGAELTGTFVDVDPAGRLELDTAGGRRTIAVSDTPSAAPA